METNKLRFVNDVANQSRSVVSIVNVQPMCLCFKTRNHRNWQNKRYDLVQTAAEAPCKSQSFQSKVKND